MMGRAVAQDRLWQMELSRRQARGRLAEVLGASGLPSDRSVLARAYTDDELMAQFNRLPFHARLDWQAYLDGINEVIQERTSARTLPQGFADHGFEPKPWDVVDSVAIAVQLVRRFGTGGSGELRNFAVLRYLEGQRIGDRRLDAFDDLIWQRDPRSIPTVPADEDPLADRPWPFPTWNRATTERHLEAIPEVPLLELIGAVALAEGTEDRHFAQAHGLVHKTGSYAIVVPPSRSASGNALFLSGPQMGHGKPNVLYEISLDAPGYRVAGVSVPGVPAVLIGWTPYLAWGLTSGVADLEDVYFASTDGQHYWDGDQRRELQTVRFTIPVKGAESVEVVQQRTHLGPVILHSRSTRTLFTVRASFAGRELEAALPLSLLGTVQTAAQARRVVQDVPVTFNLFFATREGDTGYLYLGDVPDRPSGFDWRLPLPMRPESRWRGMIPKDRMPHLINPDSVIVNWNNKPVSWWANGDTPAWGRLFRNRALVDALPKDNLNLHDLERAVWTVARQGVYTGEAFLPFLTSAPGYERELALLRSWKGWNVEGSVGAVLHDQYVRQLRRALFSDLLGGFIRPDLFDRALQPDLMLAALERRTRVDYLQGRRPQEVARIAFERAVQELRRTQGGNPATWSFTPGMIRYGDVQVPYNERGTYILLAELGPTIRTRTVAGPGASETGPHSTDQVRLVSEWRFKPGRPFPTEPDAD